MRANWASGMPARADESDSTIGWRVLYPASPRLCPGKRCRALLHELQVRRRDQHAEGLAPDDDARIVRESVAGWNRVALAAMEGAQAPEIDVLDALQVCGAADRHLRHQVDVERRAWPGLEIPFEEHCALIHTDLPFAPM